MHFEQCKEKKIELLEITKEIFTDSEITELSEINKNTTLKYKTKEAKERNKQTKRARES